MRPPVVELEHLRNRTQVFRDRFHAGEILADMLQPLTEESADRLVLAIPSGGVPVARVVARKLKIPWDLLIVRKLRIPGNTEAGFGALTSSGVLFLNDDLVSRLHLTPNIIEEERTVVEKELHQRNRIFRNNRPFPDVGHKEVFLVDDGLASGYTMIAAIHSVAEQGARPIVAVPTAPLDTVRRLQTQKVAALYCPNIRDTVRFAVADAYQTWFDLTESDVRKILNAEDTAAGREGASRAPS